MLPSYIVIALSLATFGPSSPLIWIFLMILGVWLTSLFYNGVVILRIGFLERFARASICFAIFFGQITGIAIAYLLIP